MDKKVRVVYNDGREQIVPFEELPHLDTTDLMVVHSCEPTLEEIFIRLTGEIQLLAFLLVGAIHVYINVMQLPMVKRYFK